MRVLVRREERRRDHHRARWPVGLVLDVVRVSAPARPSRCEPGCCFRGRGDSAGLASRPTGRSARFDEASALACQPDGDDGGRRGARGLIRPRRHHRGYLSRTALCAAFHRSATAQQPVSIVNVGRSLLCQGGSLASAAVGWCRPLPGFADFPLTTEDDGGALWWMPDGRLRQWVRPAWSLYRSSLRCCWLRAVFGSIRTTLDACGRAGVSTSRSARWS